MKRSSKKPNKWEDHYARRAKKERYPARSVYKLQEIQKRFRLIQKGDKVLDLGCSPGSWLLYAATLTGPAGSVVGIDLKPVTINVPAHASVITQDIFHLSDPDAEARRKDLGSDFNVVMSDMAPATTGIKDVDGARSFNLCMAALTIAQTVLKPGGTFLCKIFQGEDFNTFSDTVKNSFLRYKTFKPQSSRKKSREIYIIGLKKK